jgi:hypothetical protein
MMVSFIDAHRETYGVEPICSMLPIARSTYHEQKARQQNPSFLPERLKRDAALCPEIERVWREIVKSAGWKAVQVRALLPASSLNRA